MFIHVRIRKAGYVDFVRIFHIHGLLIALAQPAPETEEEMMVEVFKYTERVVNMARPRKVLMMAIGKAQ